MYNETLHHGEFHCSFCNFNAGMRNKTLTNTVADTVFKQTRLVQNRHDTEGLVIRRDSVVEKLQAEFHSHKCH